VSPPLRLARAASAGRGRTIAVVVPARDEAALLPRCLAAVSVAAAAVRATTTVHVVVVADACTDATEAVAARALAGLDASIVRSRLASAGGARRLGADAARCALPDAATLWIAMTDADSVVPAEWLRHQRAAAEAGWDAVAGPVVVGDWSDRSQRARRALSAHHRIERRAGRVPVHGANLGVSAAALDAVGGVPALALAEDAALVERLEQAGRAVLRPVDPAVVTSARRSTRAPGGFSTLLDALERKASA
jgi:glycosyltransferase involved in cell wall biosynthesis